MKWIFSCLRGRNGKLRKSQQGRFNRQSFVRLESRRLLSVDLRFATYNALNFDSGSADRQDEMEIVFAELDADVLVMQEVNTAGGANILLSALNANGQQYARSAFENGPDTDQMLFYRTSKVDLVSQDYIATSLRSIGEYVIRVENTLLNIYNFHLKASSGQSNEQRRLGEVTTLREHLETLPAGREFILAGDTNIHSSSEPAYQKFVQSEANNDGRAEDLLPSNLIGNWSNNFAFRSVHTQSPRTTQFDGGASGGLDDRFDMIFTNFGLNDGVGLEYVADSQFVPGNDGNHFNDSILDGTNHSASAAVLRALHDASDHLPVVADFVVLSPTGVAVTESGGSTSVSEAGSTDSLEIVLNSVPSSSVTLTATPDSELNLGRGAGIPVSLTFTPGNASVAQSLSVSAFDDSAVEGAHTGSIRFTVASSDSDYDGIAVDSVQVSITDNDGSDASGALLNEIYVNLPGTDNNREFVEILAEPLTTLTDIWLLEIEGDGSAAGTIDNAQNLSSIVAGSNGLVLLGDGYETANPWASQTSSSTSVANLNGGTMENGTISFLLVSGFSGSLGSDLDTDNDGVLDSTPWSAILDSIAWTNGGSNDRIYAPQAPTSSDSPGAATRIFADARAASANSWFTGNIASATATTYVDGSSNLPADAVITPGNYNFGATAPTLEEIRVNTSAQRSAVGELVLTFDGSVDFASDAFSVVQRGNGDGETTGVAITSSFVCSIVEDNTVVTITFDSHVRSSGVLVDGNYQLTIDGSKVLRTGTDLALGDELVFGDTESDGFFSFYGDITGDRVVNAFDLLAFRQSWLSVAGDSRFEPAFDHGADGAINAFDLLPFRQNYLQTLAFV